MVDCIEYRLKSLICGLTTIWNFYTDISLLSSLEEHKLDLFRMISSSSLVGEGRVTMVSYSHTLPFLCSSVSR